MANMSFTPAQQDAIDVRQGNILVSAAAGSGKTAVLTQRVIDLMTGENAVSADRLVIVTFTVAAAIEMKQRIQQKLGGLIEKHPESQLLQSQQLLLSKAKICTIHSLCSETIRDHFQTLGLPVGYRLAEENELRMVKNDVLEELVEECYEQKDSGFIALADSLSTKDDRKLLELVMSIYDFIRSYPFPMGKLERFQEMYKDDRPFLQTQWGVIIFEYAVSALSTAERLLSSALELMGRDEKVQKQYGPAFESDLDTVRRISSALTEGDWDRAVSILKFRDKKRIGAIRGYDDKDFLEKLKDMRKSANDLLDGLSDKYLITSDEEYREDLKQLDGKIRPLFSLVNQFYHRLQEEKLERGMIDFADLEHYMLALLLEQRDGRYRKTPAAKELSERYYEIMVDECQDINHVQNLIFWALSKGPEEILVDSDQVLTESENLFMVGDVKQSIYRFRNAMPSLFVRRKKLFADYNRESHTEKSREKILLQNNFRSRHEVTDAVNGIFRNLMTEELGEVRYDAAEELAPAASYLPLEGTETELHLLETGALGSEDEGREDKTELEAGYIAGLIEKMVLTGYPVQDGGALRPCRYRDFCILLRAKKGKTDRFVKKLKEYGINCYADASTGYFDSFEISVMLDLLRVIDNPLLDISLFSVLLSPMFGFTPDEMAQLRLVHRRAPLYLNLRTLAEGGNQKCGDFLKTLELLREQALVLTADRLIQKIYDETGFLFVVEAMVSGDQKRANLRLLLSYAESYEKIGYRGLDGFIRFIDRAIEREEDFSCANTVSEKADVVRIMSIHGSKGLEFPICITADLGKKFNLMDLNNSYLLNGDYGFGMNIRKPEELKEYANLPLEAVKLATKKETLSEEMRTLYVALTRAKEKLILVGSRKDVCKLAAKTIQSVQADGNPEPFALLHQHSFLEWLISALYRCRGFYEAFSDCYEALPEQLTELPIRCVLAEAGGKDRQEEEEITFAAQPDRKILDTLQKSIGFVYPYEELSSLPAKVTVTKIAKAKQGEQLVQLEELSVQNQEQFSGAQRGTILHSFMQYADFAAAKQDLQGEINRLVEQEFLSVREAEALNLKKVEAFMDSGLLERMLKAQRLYREYQFIYEIDASEVEEGLSNEFRTEKVLMQGIADAVLEEADGLVIIDYKTDRLSHEGEFTERYGDQLRIYRDALSNYFEKPVKECLIYSLHLEREIRLS